MADNFIVNYLSVLSMQIYTWCCSLTVYYAYLHTFVLKHISMIFIIVIMIFNCLKISVLHI